VESSTSNSASGTGLAVLIDLLQAVLRPLVLEAVGQLQGPTAAPSKTCPEFLRPKEVEAVFGLNRNTLACWRGEGRGPAYIKDGDLILYRHQDVEAYLKSRHVRTVEQPGLK